MDKVSCMYFAYCIILTIVTLYVYAKIINKGKKRTNTSLEEIITKDIEQYVDKSAKKEKNYKLTFQVFWDVRKIEMSIQESDLVVQLCNQGQQGDSNITKRYNLNFYQYFSLFYVRQLLSNLCTDTNEKYPFINCTFEFLKRKNREDYKKMQYSSQDFWFKEITAEENLSDWENVNDTLADATAMIIKWDKSLWIIFGLAMGLFMASIWMAIDMGSKKEIEIIDIGVKICFNMFVFAVLVIMLAFWVYKENRGLEKYKKDTQVCVAIISGRILHRNVSRYSVQHYYWPVVVFKDKDKITQYKFQSKDVYRSHSISIAESDIGTNALLIKLENKYILYPLLPLRKS